MIKDLIKIKQIPVIEEQLKSVSKVIDERVENAINLVCTDETVKAVKEIRANMNKDYKEFEAQRKLVKEQVLKPYNDFENIYKKYISDKFKNADIVLKQKIDAVEDELKAKKEQEVKDYFEEYKTANNIDFIKYEQARINVTLTASMKSLKGQAKEFIDKVADDLKLIETQEHKAEILVEYKQTLNVSNAITTVMNRFKAIEEEKKKQEFIKEASKAVIISKEEKQEILQMPVVEEKQEDDVLTVSFKATATRALLKELKKFMEERGIKYE